MILDMGCKNAKRKNAIGIDIDKDSDADVFCDLNDYLPFKDNVFNEIWCRHVFEHIFDIIGFIREIHRICKLNATIKVMTPHFSSMGAWSTLDHKREFSCLSFKDMEQYGFKLLHSEIRYAMKSERKLKWWESIVNRTMNFLANRSLYLTERVWCYWFGGFNEIYVKLKKRRYFYRGS